LLRYHTVELYFVTSVDKMSELCHFTISGVGLPGFGGRVGFSLQQLTSFVGWW